MQTAELDENLARFYVETRTKKGISTACSALFGVRNSIERRWLKQQWLHRKNNKEQRFSKE